MTTKEVPRPIPTPTNESKPFWEATKRHELFLQRCKKCHQFYFPPSYACAHCGSIETEWAKASGKGKVYTWCTFFQPFVQYFTNDIPYAVVMVELAEGPRMLSRIIDVKHDELKIDMPVEVVFEEVSEEITLPKFKRTS